MKIGPLRINLANSSKPPTDAEIGTGRVHLSYFNGEVINPSKIRIKDYIAMRENDGTVASLYNIITMPVLANPFSFEADEEDVGIDPDAAADVAEGEEPEEFHPQADFVNKVFTLPPHQGGMTIPFKLVIADMLRAISEGYRSFEKVWAINDDGMIVYKKIASRDNQSVIIREDDRGGFDGFDQWAYIDNTLKRVTIPQERAFLFTYGKEKDFLYGQSAFKAAYYHYDKKHRLYYLANQGVQQFAIPPKVGIAPPNAKQTVIDDMTAALDKMATNSSVTLPNGATAATLSASGRIDPISLIDHHNAEMARSVLAHFILLGTSDKTGSYALSQDQSDMFIVALKGLLHLIEEHINYYLIPDLIDYNFADPHYPKFQFGDITDATRDIAKEAFLTISRFMPQGVPDWVATGVALKMAETLDIDKPDGVSDEGTYGVHAPAVQPTTPPATPPADPNAPAPAAPATQSHAHRREARLADNKWFRPLTPAEKKVNFSGLQNKLDTLENDYLGAVKPIWDQVKADAVKQVRKLLEAKDYKAIENFTLSNGDKYRAAIQQAMMDAYTYAKNGAADELGRNIPATSADTKVVIAQKAKAIADKQYSDMEFMIRNAVTEALRKNQLSKPAVELSIGDLLSTVSGFFPEYFDKNIGTGATAFIGAAVNIGRSDVFDTYKNSIQSYQYSAILDDSTCPICEDLDGTVADEADYTSSQWQPPIHFNCRCIWVAIGSDEQDPPPITGMPENPGGVSQPLLHYEHKHFILKGRRANAKV
jgi:SPP1 gp7 family putative phage head morphogenesis protein